jgi:hypothetical protein
MDDRFDTIIDDEPIERGRVVEPGMEDVGIAAPEVGDVARRRPGAAAPPAWAATPWRSDPRLR